LAGEIAVEEGLPHECGETLSISIDKSFYGMGMEAVIVSPKYQVVIPQRVRERLGIKPGDRMMVMEKDNLIYLVRISNMKDAKGFLGKKISTKGLRDEGERFG
jgi:AbrB family looped-hinge helix DNA binding protein